MAPRKYTKKMIEKVIDTYEHPFGSKTKRSCCLSFEKGDHPKMDTTKWLDTNGMQMYQSLIAAMQWTAVSLGQFDKSMAVMTLSGFQVRPLTIGHLERAKHVYGYFTQSEEQEYDRMFSVYGDMEEQIPHDAPTPLGKKVRITHYVW
jgi:hypothetical protein